MEILDIAGSAYEDYDDQMLMLFVKLDAGEAVSIGDDISIPMIDGPALTRQVMLINPRRAGDYAPISKLAASKVASGEWGTSKKPVTHLDGPLSSCEVVVLDVPYHEVLTEENLAARRFFERRQKMVCLTPFKELGLGGESIHDWVQEGYSVPEKVIAYLRTTEPDIMSPGIYEHPFKPRTQLLGPYCYGDDRYWWDRDAWKYVVKYHVRLPQEFVDYVMSGAGDEFLRARKPSSNSWHDAIEGSYGNTAHGNFLPRDAGDKALEDF